MHPGEDLNRPRHVQLRLDARRRIASFASSGRSCRKLLTAGAIEGTDVETLKTARKELSQLGR